MNRKAILKIALTKNNVRSLRRHNKVIKKVVFSRVKGKENKEVILKIDKIGEEFRTYFTFKNNTTGVVVDEIRETRLNKLPKTLEKNFDLEFMPAALGKRFCTYIEEQIKMINLIGGIE